MKAKKILFWLIIITAFLIRLYRLNYPLADWHSWRQADTSAVSRNFLKQGLDLLHPRFDDLSNIPSGKENPEGYRFVEFPIYNLLHVLSSKLLPFLNFEACGRLVSILFSLLSLVFLYLIVKEFLGERTGLVAAFFFAFLPFNIYYSRVILPEAMMVAMSLGAIYFYSRFWPVSLFFTLIALLLKPFTVFLIFPALFYLTLKKPMSFKLVLSFLFYWSVVILPFFWWRWWMSHYPEGIPANDWLFNAGNIRFKGAFFYWLFAERLGKLILGYWGLIPFGLGLIIRPKKEGWFFHFWLLGVLVYFIVIAAGNVRHDYYQVLSVPIICLFLAKGTTFLFKASEDFSRPLGYALLLICIVFSLAFSWYSVRDYFNVNNWAIVKAGQAVDQLLPKDAKVIAPYGGDTAFLYQTNRQGWPVGISIEKMIQQGAQFYVNVNFGPETDWLMSLYPVLAKTDDYVIIKLK